MTETTLQRVDLNPPLEISRLYFHPTLAAQSREPVASSDEGIDIPAGAAVSFDSYFNSFFESYWFGYTSLQSICLRLEVEGDCIVTLWRQSPERDVYLIDQQQVRAGAATTVTFDVHHDDELRVEAGRIWFQVEALSRSTVRNARWTTDAQPQRPVSLGVVFCTFNRQKYLQRILRAIDADEAAVDAVGRVFVVNQGDGFSAAEIIGENSNDRLLPKMTIIEQPNMGGCGGFTRGMYESIKDPELTHFLLMDDDSRVNAESIARTVQFLAYADENVVVGGHMLNLHRPNRLFEAGAMLDAASLQPHPINHNLDLADFVDLERFLRTGAVSYNGWWMFGAATSVVESIGYPMPCFIRGDDMEFGMRVRDAGLQTVPVPGIAVWHEPFYLKLGGWQFYFEVRNRLAMASLHRHPNFDGIRKDLRKVFARDIAMCRYHSCTLMLQAIKDYRDGPAVALDTTNGPLMRARELVDEFGPSRVDDINYAASDSEEKDIRNRGELRKMLDTAQVAAERRISKAVLAAQIVRRVVVPSDAEPKSEPVIRARDLKPHSAANYDSYVVVEEHGGVGWRFRRDRAIEQRLWREFFELAKHIEFDGRYLDEFESTNGFADTWQKIFADVGGAAPSTNAG